MTTRIALYIFAIVLFSVGATQGQSVEDSARLAAAEEGFVTHVVRLEHADAEDAARTIRATIGCNTGIDRRTNSVVVTGATAEVEIAAKLLGELDTPMADGESIDSALIRIDKEFSQGVTSLLSTRITHRTQTGYDRHSGMLALRGPAEEIQSVRELIAIMELELREKHGESELPRALRASFFFVRCRTTPAGSGEKVDVSGLPEAILPVVPVLLENGFSDPQVLTCLMVHVENEESFRVEGRTMADGKSLSVQIHGEAEMYSDGDAVVAEMKVEAKIAVQPVGDKGLPDVVFEIGSHLSAPVGDWVVLAASPVAEDGVVVLIVRLAPVE